MNTVRHLIDRHAADQPDKPFLLAPETDAVMSYARLREHVLDIAAHLDVLAVGQGDKVAFLVPNGYWTTALFLGVMYSGRVIVPLNAVSGGSALSYVIEHSDCRLLFVDPVLGEKFAAVLADLPSGVRTINTSVEHGPAWPDADPRAVEPPPVDEKNLEEAKKGLRDLIRLAGEEP